MYPKYQKESLREKKLFLIFVYKKEKDCEASHDKRMPVAVHKYLFYNQPISPKTNKK